MGLDGVDLVMEVEQRFGVTIADEEASGIRTVGDLLALLEERLAKRDVSTCLALPWFLKLRQCVRNVLGDGSVRIRPPERLTHRLDPNERRELWRQLERLLGSRPRALQRPDWIERPLAGMLCLSVASVLVCPWVALAVADWRFFVSVPVLVFVTAVAYLLTRPWCVYPPPGYETFGDITRRLVGLEAATVGYPAGDPSLLLEELALIISDLLGVDRDEVVPEARFVEDLNLG